jgi:hypothetical protein
MTVWEKMLSSVAFRNDARLYVESRTESDAGPGLRA